MAYCSINKMPCLDPCVFLENVAGLAASNDRQWLDVAGRAGLASLVNRFIDVSGPVPSYGYFAVTRDVVDAVSNSRISIELVSGNTVIRRSGLYFVRATGMAPIAPSKKSPKDSFVMEIADARYFGNHRWMQLDGSGDKMFNVPATAYGQDQYYEDTINSDTGNPWSWQEMFAELWPTFLGKVPALPRTFTNIPVGFDFRSYTAYQAVQIVLDALTLSLAPNDDGTFYVTNTGTPDSFSISNDFLFNKFSGAVDEDIEYIEHVVSYYPKGVAVQFQKTATNSGSENAFTKAGGQWYADMIHVEQIDATDAQLQSLERGKLLTNTYHQIWDDMPCWVDPYTGAIANQADLTVRANERMRNYYSNLIDIDFRTHGCYSALVPFDLSGTMQAVSWVQQLRRGGAWSTEYWCHPREQMGVEGGDLIAVTSRPSSPWQWRSAPIYPPETMLWRNDGFLSSGSGGGTSDDEYNGTEIRYDPATKQFIDGIYVKGVQTP